VTDADDPTADTFLREHMWAVLATGRRDGSPQQSMIGYVVDDDGRIVISAKAYTAKWHNARRQPSVSLTVPDGRAALVVYGTAEAIADDPERAELTSRVMGRLMGTDPPDPSSLAEMLESQQRTVLRIAPTRTIFHE